MGNNVTRIASSPIAVQALEGIQSNGGITIGMDGSQPHQGFAFTVDQHSEGQYPLQTLTADQIDQYIQSHMQLLQAPGRYLGAWVNNGTVYLDVSQVEQDRDRAHQMAQQANQLAMFDLATFEEIPTTSPQTAQPATVAAWHLPESSNIL
jgi:hypothetical protein